jgi:hypothetical protein
VDLVAEMSVYNPFDFFLEPAAENFPFVYDAGCAELAPYLATEAGHAAGAKPTWPRIDRKRQAAPSTSWSASTSGAAA